ncbi:MAG TPA: FtsQ-type POTRA domain-containing protein, partial [Myxococcota bacterium]|nr:FtsQ-type POTRA domain-containing protein [Myxococcota bacterium]
MGLPRQVRLSLLGVASVATLGWAVLRPDLMYVERIEFVGNVRATDAELRHLSDLRNGVTIWDVDLATLSERVQRHPWVAEVTAERHLPGSVVVKVQEHAPVALLAFGDRLLYVDEQGRPFLEARSDDLNHPIISGIDPALEGLHPELPRLALRDALWLLQELDARAILPLDHVSEIRFHRTRGFVLQTAGSVRGGATAEVLIGLGDYERQLRHLAALVDRGVDLTRPLHVDVAPESVAIVRPRDGVGPAASLVPPGASVTPPARPG